MEETTCCGSSRLVGAQRPTLTGQENDVRNDLEMVKEIIEYETLFCMYKIYLHLPLCV